MIVMEAMKMEHTIKANVDSVVDKVFFGAGDLVDGDVELISLRSEEDIKVIDEEIFMASQVKIIEVGFQEMVSKMRLGQYQSKLN